LEAKADAVEFGPYSGTDEIAAYQLGLRDAAALARATQEPEEARWKFNSAK
jgi:hypothetical protein